MDDPNDFCAHGRVKFQINNKDFIKPSDGLWTVSTAALFLLRALEESHATEKNVTVTEGNYLFPCCGFSVWPNEGKYKVICIGCNQGIDLSVIINKDSNTVVISKDNSETIGYSAWQTAVCKFVDQVAEFYQKSIKKIEPTDELDRQGWKLFWEEWNLRRRTTAENLNKFTSKSN